MLPPTASTQKSRYALWIILALVIIFIGPMVAAWSLYTVNNTWLEEKVNYGQLVQPPLDFTKLPLNDSDGHSVDAKTLRGQWLLIYINEQVCDKNCHNNLYTLQQLWLALGKNRNRVQRLYISSLNTKKINVALPKQFPGMQMLVTRAIQLNQFFTDKNIAPDSSARFYLVDPLGNLMMAYAADTKPKAVYSDLTRLLSVSQVG